MKRLSVCLLVVGWALGATVAAEAAFTYEDVDYWVGTGSNRAVLVIDWNNGASTESIAWGYCWDGTATGWDMLSAITGSGYLKDSYDNPAKENLGGADGRLFACISDWGWGGTNGYTVFGLGYDADGDGGSFVATYEGGESGYATDGDDYYSEGWYDGYWSYWVGTGDDPWSEGTWDYSGWGMGSRPLADGDWDGWSWSSFAAFGSGGAPDVPVAAAVPEPTTLCLLASGMVWCLKRRCR